MTTDNDACFQVSYRGGLKGGFCIGVDAQSADHRSGAALRELARMYFKMLEGTCDIPTKVMLADLKEMARQYAKGKPGDVPESEAGEVVATAAILTALISRGVVKQSYHTNVSFNETMLAAAMQVFGPPIGQTLH